MADSASAVNGPKIGKLIYADIGANTPNGLRALMRALDVLLQGNVIDIAITAPPGSPANGDAYIVPTGATGAWAGQTNAIAYWSTQIATVDTNTKVPAWEFFTPQNGWCIYVRSTQTFYIFNGTAWTAALNIGGRLSTGLITNGAAGATPTIDASLGNDFVLTLTANASPTISNPPSAGQTQELNITWVQNGTGAWTVTWPGSVKGGGAPSAAAASISSQSYKWNGTNWIAKAAMITGM